MSKTFPVIIFILMNEGYRNEIFKCRKYINQERLVSTELLGINYLVSYKKINIVYTITGKIYEHFEA